ncbi:MAG: LysE family transporter [Rhodospirillales bacterium]|nr:LysE family transporter [Rhodospirillales bacterium]
MIDSNLYMGFVLATVALILLPGPIVTLTIANSLAYGTRHGLRTVMGTSLASALLLLVGGLGMASIFALLAQWFEVLRWVGAGYLIWLGVQQWRARAVNLAEAEAHLGPKKSLFWQGFVVSITNPKTIFFYAALFPQFIDPAQAAGPQLLVLSVTFLVIATTLDCGYALLSGHLRPLLSSERRGRIRNRISGAFLIGTGLFIALARKS